jgi:hypothetical protein
VTQANGGLGSIPIWSLTASLSRCLQPSIFPKSALKRDAAETEFEELTSAIEQEGKKRSDVLRLDDISWCAPTRAIGSGSTGVV